MSQKFSPNLIQESSRLLYSLLISLLLPFLLVNLLVRICVRAPGYRWRNIERFAVAISASKKGGILLHCVSVGEVVAAANLVKRLLAEQPNLVVTITTTTVTGADRVEQIFAGQVQHCYLPYDVPILMNILLAKIQPTKVLITEVELWPNLIHCCWKRSIPVYVINARMTDKSARTYRKIPALFTPILHKISHVFAQGQRDYDNYLALGIEPQNLTLTNNIKFDQRTDNSELAVALAMGERLKLSKRRLLVAGSTHEGEEELLIKAYQQLKVEFPELLLVIVPRHPQRFELVFQLCQRSGLNSTRISGQSSCDMNSDILLVDQMGTLRSFYALADIAFVGGSIADRGGHNALEPAAYSVPILMGPHIYNNPQICQILSAAGALQTVHDCTDIVEHCRIWLTNEQQRIQAGKAGNTVLTSNAGAIDKTLSLLNF